MYTKDQKDEMQKQGFVFMRAQFNAKKQVWEISQQDSKTGGWKKIVPNHPYQTKELAIVEIQCQQRTNSKIVIDN